MKRATRDWPKQIVEVGATQARRRDPRSDDAEAHLDPRLDPQATQKISREQLDAVLKGTASGFRPAVRSEPGDVEADEPTDLADVMLDSLRSLEAGDANANAHANAHEHAEANEESAARSTAIATPAVMAPVTFEPLPEVVARGTAQQQLTPSRLRERLPVPARIALLAVSAIVLSIALGSLIALLTGRR